MQQLQATVHPRDLFEGLQTERDIYRTVKQKLNAIVQDTRNHCQLGEEVSSIRKLVPEPFRKSVAAIGKREKWPAEAMVQGLLANTGWLEHVNTKLSPRHTDEHKRSLNVPAFFGADASSRKSSLHRFITQWLLDADGVRLSGVHL